MRECNVSEILTDAFQTLPEALAAVKEDEVKLKEREAIRIVIHVTQHLTALYILLLSRCRERDIRFL